MARSNQHDISAADLQPPLPPPLVRGRRTRRLGVADAGAPELTHRRYESAGNTAFIIRLLHENVHLIHHLMAAADAALLIYPVSILKALVYI